MSEHVVLVDEQDRPRGTADKLQAHVDGLLHRAFSIFVFDERGRLLLQKRTPSKYHSGGLWSNTCCSHPRPGESLEDATRRRLVEEMGFECRVTPLFGFHYRADVGAGLTENEFDHVFFGSVSGPVDVQPDPSEVADWAWIDPAALRTRVAQSPEDYTVWFRLLLDDTLAAARAKAA